MAKVWVDGTYLDVRIEEELAEFELDNEKNQGDKIICASPFRQDSHPSFFIDLETGGWGDSGAIDMYLASGNFAKLMSLLREETPEETNLYLQTKYGRVTVDEGGKVRIDNIEIKSPGERVEIDEDQVGMNVKESVYLSQTRGIGAKVQTFLGTGLNTEENAVAIPWRHTDGTLANVKYRHTEKKVFWYENGGHPINELVFGLDKLYKHERNYAVINEAEIDAMSYMNCGRPAIATGGSALTRTQIEAIKKSPIERLLISRDNDSQGKMYRDKVVEAFRGYIPMYDVELPTEYKDANDAMVDGVDLKQLGVREIKVFKVF